MIESTKKIEKGTIVQNNTEVNRNISAGKNSLTKI